MRTTNLFQPNKEGSIILKTEEEEIKVFLEAPNGEKEELPCLETKSYRESNITGGIDTQKIALSILNIGSNILGFVNGILNVV